MPYNRLEPVVIRSHSAANVRIAELKNDVQMCKCANVQMGKSTVHGPQSTDVNYEASLPTY